MNEISLTTIVTSSVIDFNGQIVIVWFTVCKKPTDCVSLNLLLMKSGLICPVAQIARITKKNIKWFYDRCRLSVIFKEVMKLTEHCYKNAYYLGFC